MRHFDLEIDMTGLKCPIPVVRARKAMDKLASGQVLHITSDDEISCANFPVFVQQNGHEMVETYQEGSTYHYFIRKKTN